jgi:hypothetical protein
MNKFDRTTFESPNFQLETSEAPKIKYGASSSSNILNRYIETLARDLRNLLSRSSAIAQRTDRVLNLASSQSAALLGQFQDLSSRVNQASGYSKILCGMFSSFYVDLLNTTATLDYNFGQATLPIQASTDLLTQTDLAGRAKVSSEVELSYAVGSSPAALEYVIDPDAVNMLKDEQTWVLGPVPTNTIVWTKLKAPLQYKGLTPNVLELWPACSFALDLLEVSYLGAGESFTGSWVPLDLSYLPNYQQAGNKVAFCGPVRLHLPNIPMSELRIKMQARAQTYWGWSRIKLYHRDYENSAVLVVQDPYSRSVSTPFLRGKDNTQLSQLSTTINGSSARVNLSTTNSAQTPVITGIILNV